MANGLIAAIVINLLTSGEPRRLAPAGGYTLKSSNSTLSFSSSVCCVQWGWTAHKQSDANTYEQSVCKDNTKQKQTWIPNFETCDL
jgi:hypothetical protein